MRAGQPLFGTWCGAPAQFAREIFARCMLLLNEWRNELIITTKARIGFTTVALSLVLSGPALAEGPGWVSNRTVVAMVNTWNGGFNVRLSPDLTGCTSQSGYGPNYASVFPDHQALKNMKADLLTALVTGKPVSLYLADNTCKVSEMILGPYY
jgi:hypothetical protein